MKVILLVSVLGLAVCTGAWAQASAGFGAVSGYVIEAGAQGMPDATVLLTNPTLGTKEEMITTDDGVFGDESVVPAAGYHLSVTRKGFQSWQSGSFTVTAGQTATFNIPLVAEGGNDKVKAGELPVDITKTGVSDGITPDQVNNLPTNGRRLDQLIPLAPAVTMAESDPGIMVARALPFSNLFLLDGIDATNSYFTQYPGIARQISQDAVQDFQVMSDGYPTEFGRAIGGIVNAATRSGGTGYHGSVYDYWHNRGMQSYDNFAVGANTRQKFDQGGADFGGPIYGKRLFFYLNFEGLYRDGNGVNRITNPLITDLYGNSVLASNCAASAAQCAAARKFLQSQMNVLVPLPVHSQTGLAKIDYRRSDRNTFTFEANAMHYNAPSLAQFEDVAPNGGMLGDPTLHEETRFAQVAWTGTVSPVTQNDLRVGFYQDRIAEVPTQTGLSTGLLGINIAGTTVGSTLPYNVVLPSERRIQVVDNFHRSYGTHLFEAGLDISQTRDYIDSLANPTGLYTYNSLTAFAEDLTPAGTATTPRNYTTFAQTFGNPTRTLTMKEFNFYGNDTWKPTQRLTVTYGLRYERPFLPQPTETNTNYYQTGNVASPWLDLSGRAGIAFMLDSRTVVRAGFGMFYAPFPGVMMDNLFLGNGLYQTQILANPNQTGAPIFPNILPSASAIPTGMTNIAYAAGKLKNPYTEDANIQLERQVYRDWTLTLGFIHTRGYDMWTSTDENLTAPTINKTYAIDNAAGQSVSTYTTPYYTAKNNTNFAQVWQIENGGSYWYNAITGQFKMPLSHGVTVWATYTYSRAKDDLGINSALGFAMVGSSNGNFASDYGPSAYNQPNRAVIRATWSPTLRGGQPAVLRHLVNGWGLSGIATVASGMPVTPLVNVEGQQFSAVTMDYTTSLNGSGGWNRVPFEPVGNLTLPQQHTFDARVARTFSFSERFKGTVAFEAFNILNQQYATMVNAVQYVSVAPLAAGLINGPQSGVMKPVPGFGAGIASQGFPNGFNARTSQLMFRLDF